MMRIRNERSCKGTERFPYNTIPALLIGQLATHEEYERRGVGKMMVAWATKMAIELSKVVCCRMVVVHPHGDVVGRCEKQKLKKISGNPPVMHLDVKGGWPGPVSDPSQRPADQSGRHRPRLQPAYLEYGGAAPLASPRRRAGRLESAGAGQRGLPRQGRPGGPPVVAVPEDREMATAYIVRPAGHRGHVDDVSLSAARTGPPPGCSLGPRPIRGPSA